MRIPTILVLDQGDGLLRQVERDLAGMRPRALVAHCPDIATIDDVLRTIPIPDVLVAGVRLATPDGLRQLRLLRIRLAGAGLILAFEAWKPSRLRDVVRTGAVDIVRLPGPDGALAEAVQQALESRPARTEAAPDAGAAGSVGEVYLVASGTGGCGKTFFATNLAYHLQSNLQKRICLLDLDLQFGELATALRLKTRTTIVDLLGQDDERDLAARLPEHLIQHDTGVYLLAAPDEPAEADSVDPADVGRIIEALRSRFDYVIVDTPAALSEGVLKALEYADQVFAMATLDLPSIHNLSSLLNTLKRLHVPPERTKLVLNKVEPDVGIDIPQVTRYFPQGFSIVVPYGRDANRSLNMGMPLLAFAPRSDISRVLSDGLGTHLALPPAAGEGKDEPPRRLSGLSGLRRRKTA